MKSQVQGIQPQANAVSDEGMSHNLYLKILDYTSLGLVWVLAALFIAVTYDQWSMGGHPAGVPIEIWAFMPVGCTFLTRWDIKKRLVKPEQPVSTA